MSTPPRLQDPLVRHYVELIELIEVLIIARVPRIPLMPTPKPLDARDILDVAERFAAAHDVRGRT